VNVLLGNALLLFFIFSFLAINDSYHFLFLYLSQRRFI